MPPSKNRWGWMLCGVSMAGIFLSLYLPYGLPYKQNTDFYKETVPYLGLCFAVLAIVAGHFSYARVHNLRVYLGGYVLGLAGVCYFFLYDSPWKLPFNEAPAGFKTFLYMMLFVNLFVLIGVPSFLKYRFARAITLGVLAAELIVLLAVRFASPNAAIFSQFRFTNALDAAFWLGPFCAIAIFALTYWRIRYEYYLGGIITGFSLITAFSWSAQVSEPYSEPLFFCAGLLYWVTGTLFYWFIRMDHRSSYDPLLQIYNRDYCSKIISEQANLNVNPPFAVAMVDIDHFKKVNDTHGHQAGDAVLYTIAQAVDKGIGENGIVCRYGGEELAVFFPQKSTKDVVPLMEQIRADIEKIKTPAMDKQIGVTISCGVSHREQFAHSIINVIHAADSALYKAKKGGRNQVKSAKTTGSSSRK